MKMKIFNMKWLAVVGIILIGGLSAFTISEMNNKVEETVEVETKKQTHLVYIEYDINGNVIPLDPNAPEAIPVPIYSNPYNCPNNGANVCSRGFAESDLKLEDGMLVPDENATSYDQHTWSP